MVKFRIVQFDMAMPVTGYRFFIEWKQGKKILGFIPWWGKWEAYLDPSRTTGPQGYLTIQEAKGAIDVYKKTMTPVYHYI